MRLCSTFVLGTVCLAISHADTMCQSFSVANAIVSWFMRFREHAFKILAINSAQRLLPPISDVLTDLLVARPNTQPVSKMVDVPRTHFVVFGSGGVLPDFEGPFSVDAVYRNKRWANSVYFAVWVGYYENRKIAIGVDAHTTYSDICQFLMTQKEEITSQEILKRMRRNLRKAFYFHEHMTLVVVKRLVITCERYFIWESEMFCGILGNSRYTIGTGFYYWLDWTVRWNTVRAFGMLLRMWWPKRSTRPKTKLQNLAQATMSHTLLHHGLYLVDISGSIVFTSPTTVACFLTYIASLASVPISLGIWNSIYLSHRLIVLKRCIGLSRNRS